MNNFSRVILSTLCYLFFFISCSIFAEETEFNTQNTADTNKEFNWSDYKKPWMDDFQVHGFLSQGLFSSSGNNVYGKSKDSVSAGSTELGLNLSYQALNNLSFAVQGLYRRAGEITGSEGEVSLDFAFIDYTFFRHNKGRLGVRGGRVKNPWGLYNETRDVASTHPTIFLPLAYFERSRSLFLSMDGAQFYTDYNTSVGDFSFKFNLGVTNPSDKELLLAVTRNPFSTGSLASDLSFLANLNYDINNGEYIFAISYANLGLKYNNAMPTDPNQNLDIKIDSLMLSAQYNGEKFSLTGEYSLQWNQFNNLYDPAEQKITDSHPVSEHWYIQTGYRVLDNLQFTLRYDSSTQDISDRDGTAFAIRYNHALPNYLGFTKDIVFGARWDITPAWMVRAEYHRVHGTSTLSALDNPDIFNLVEDWNIYALQVAYQF